MSRQLFNTLVGMGSGSHDFDDELEISFSLKRSLFAQLRIGILHLDGETGRYRNIPPAKIDYILSV